MRLRRGCKVEDHRAGDRGDEDKEGAFPQVQVLRIRGGAVFIYLNKGLDDLDVKFLAARILIHKDEALTPCLVADDFRNAVYKDTDP